MSMRDESLDEIREDLAKAAIKWRKSLSTGNKEISKEQALIRIIDELIQHLKRNK